MSTVHAGRTGRRQSRRVARATSPEAAKAAIRIGKPSQRSARRYPNKSANTATNRPAPAAAAKRRDGMMPRRATHAAVTPTKASNVTCHVRKAPNVKESGSSSAPVGPQPVRNGTMPRSAYRQGGSPGGRGPANGLAERGCRSWPTALRRPRRSPGTTVAFNNTATPATSPQVTGRSQRAAQAEACKPMIVASMAGQELKKVCCWWKPGRVTCMSPEAAVSTSAAATAARWARERASDGTG